MNLTIPSSGPAFGRPLMSNVRCRENAGSSARLALHTSPIHAEMQCAAAQPAWSQRKRSQFSSRLGWAVRPLAAGEPLVKHSPHSTPTSFWAARPAAGRSPVPPTEGIRLHLVPTLGVAAAALQHRPRKARNLINLEVAHRSQLGAHSARHGRASSPAMQSRLCPRTAPNHSIKRTCPWQAAYVTR
jgi:hypothetical protein